MFKSWYDCAIENGRKIRKSDYLKFWREVYIRYDYCSEKELLKHANENCTTDNSFDNLFIIGKTKAWNFDEPILNDLKQFLVTFATK